MRPAYARKLLERQAAGEPVRLVILVLRDWSACKLMEERAGVVRLVMPPDAEVADLDLSMLFGLDVLVIGEAATDADFLSVLRLALASGAGSVWGDYDEGLFRVEPCGRGVLAKDHAAHPDAVLDLLPALRLGRLLMRDGVYGSELFREARLAAVGEVFGARMAERLRARDAEKVAA
jgi:hypothetical protein